MCVPSARRLPGVKEYRLVSLCAMSVSHASTARRFVLGLVAAPVDGDADCNADCDDSSAP